MAKRSMVDLDEDDEEEEKSRQVSRWTREEEISLITSVLVQIFENNNIEPDRNEYTFLGAAPEYAYEAKKEKEMAYTECKELKFLMIDVIARH
ncbi:hypothetical protein Tco_0379350 [Tanacetum coccineum]